MMAREYKDRFNGVSEALIVDIRGIEANDNNELRLELHSKNIRITVIRNSLAKDAFQGTNLEGILPCPDWANRPVLRRRFRGRCGSGAR